MIKTMSCSENQSEAKSFGDQLKMVQAISCVVDQKYAVYISGPITTGKNFIEWYMLCGASLSSNEKLYNSRLRAEVIKKNEAEIINLARKTRREVGAQVIEPASLFISEWSQLEYISFWMKIIDSFVSEIILVDGWQYSIGCATEYNFARAKGIPIRNHHGELLGERQGKLILTNAAREVEELAGKDVILGLLASGLRKAATEK